MTKTVVRLSFALAMGVSALVMLLYNNIMWDSSGPAILSSSWLVGFASGVAGILLLALAGSYGVWAYKPSTNPATGRPEIFQYFLRRNTRQFFGLGET